MIVSQRNPNNDAICTVMISTTGDVVIPSWSDPEECQVICTIPKQIMNSDPVVGGSFAENSGESMTLIVLHESGDIYSVAPLVFGHNACYNLNNLLALYSDLGINADLNHHTTSSDNYDHARTHQVKAGRAFLRDIFSLENVLGDENVSTDTFVAAQFDSRSTSSSAFGQDLKYNGPIISGDNSASPPTSATSLALIHSSSDGYVFAVGKADGSVDFCVCESNAITMRFGFESEEDEALINDAIINSGAIVNRVGFDHLHSTQVRATPDSDAFYSLLLDPLDPSLLHCASGNYGIHTISFDLAKLLSSEENPFDAYAVLTLGSSNSTVCGMAVYNDPTRGHQLLADVRTYNKSEIHKVNLDSVKMMNELVINGGGVTKKLPPSSDPNVHSLQEISPFTSIAAPLLAKIKNGLASTGQLVGSSTQLKDSNSATIATALKMKKMLDNSIVDPLTELGIRTEMRRALLKDVHANNIQNIKKLKEAIDKLRVSVQTSVKRGNALEVNSVKIGDRSELCLKTSREVCKSLTRAEEEYFQQIKTLQGRCGRWDVEIKGVKAEAKGVVETVDPVPRIALKEEHSDISFALLDGQRKLLNDCERDLSVLRFQTGLNADDDNEAA